jgi:hypothetical protein
MFIKEEEKEREDKEKEDKEREDKEREDKVIEEKKRKKKEDKLKEYSKIVNYPGMNVTMQTVTETDTQLFNNLFNETHVVYQNNIKRYLFCSTIFILYAIIAYMYYYFIYSN